VRRGKNLHRTNIRGKISRRYKISQGKKSEETISEKKYVTVE